MMVQTQTEAQAPVAPVTVAKDLTMGDLRAALAAGWRDFMARPLFGLFFAGIYVAAGLFLYFALFSRGEIAWLVPAAAGFPLLAPFVAVGLYEVSRRREAGLPMSWANILGAIVTRGHGQLAVMGMVVFIIFGFWLGIAHAIFSIFLADSGVGSGSLGVFLTTPGILMMLVGSIVGALMALAFFSTMVVSLPMLVDRDVDFVTAIITSLATVRSNTRVMFAWAVIVALSLFAAMLPFFLGLLIVLPVLAHATWHLYRRAVRSAAR